MQCPLPSTTFIIYETNSSKMVAEPYFPQADLRTLECQEMMKRRE